jgi:hypothetical protein
MKIRPVGSELFHADGRTDGRTDITKLIVALKECHPRCVYQNYSRYMIKE